MRGLKLGDVVVEPSCMFFFWGEGLDKFFWKHKGMTMMMMMRKKTAVSEGLRRMLMRSDTYAEIE